ncbi:MAG: hypothetical protein JST79_13255 [Acidobacteria bacterium]|nr:hypothetical protein [Acidobacteriota bacterium]
MPTAVRPVRQKISTTISPAALAYFEQIIASGEAQTLAEAIDLSVERLRTYENRERLESDTADYFARLSPEALAEETSLGNALSQSASGIDVDREP